MTTMELIEHGIGHNCLSDAYDLGLADGINEGKRQTLNAICKEQNELLSTDGIYGHDGVVTISQSAFDDIQAEIRNKALDNILVKIDNYDHCNIDYCPRARDDDACGNKCMLAIVTMIKQLKGNQT